MWRLSSCLLFYFLKKLIEIVKKIWSKKHFAYFCVTKCISMNSSHSNPAAKPVKTAFLKGRGAQINPTSRFDKYVYDTNPLADQEPDVTQLKTAYTEVHPKTILNKVDSPDIPMDFSMNPYQGCEHGCIYCYARNTHPYWGYSAGLEFEQKIMVKKNAAKLLEDRIRHPKWKAVPIMLSGNTDCYQPVERKRKITRAMLEVLWKYRHPVGIITKNSLILRDLGLLQKMAAENLVKVSISITTLDEKLRQLMEPRTTTANERFRTVELLATNGIPVSVMLAPIIPGLNDHEIFKILKRAASVGAYKAGYTLVRLNGDVETIFTDWIEKTYPARAEKVLNKIRSCHGGKTSDSRSKTRMVGEGNIAEIINRQFKLAHKKFFKEKKSPAYNCELHEVYKTNQLKLF